MTVGDAVNRGLSEVEEEIYQVRNRRARDTLNFPIRLNNRIGALFRVVETGAARPTDQSHVVFKQLSADLDVQLGKLDDALSTEITRFNRHIRMHAESINRGAARAGEGLQTQV